MGSASITASRLFSGGSDFDLALDKFPVLGHVRTYSLNQFVTDSAAAATALASGHKTNNQMVGLSPSGEPFRTIIDDAKAAGYRTGVITNTSVTDATPAAYYAHVPSRKMEREIAKFLINSNVDVLMGGGQHFFDIPLQKELTQKGWKVAQTFNPTPTANLPNRYLGIFADKEIPYIAQRVPQDPHPRLTDMVHEAIRLLEANQDHPYFLMIESGLIDRAAHKNLTRFLLLEMDELNSLLKELMALPDTLIVVTADHETGGLSLNSYMDVTQARGLTIVTGNVEYGSLASWATGPQHVLERMKRVGQPTTSNITVSAEELEAHGSGWVVEYSAHTAVDVPIFAKGLGQELFSGTMDNTQVAIKLRKLLHQRGQNPYGK